MGKSLKIAILAFEKRAAESMVLSAFGENHLFLAKNHNFFLAESQGLASLFPVWGSLQ
jgi:hypothetical protein